MFTFCKVILQKFVLFYKKKIKYHVAYFNDGVFLIKKCMLYNSCSS